MIPRIRTVKPELFKHEVLFEAEKASQLPLRVAFIGLFGCCDRAGRFRWRPQRLKLDMLPYDEVNMVEVLDTLVNYGFIKKYTCQGEWYGCIPSWSRHQCINQREPESDIPPMPETVPNEPPSTRMTAVIENSSDLNMHFVPHTFVTETFIPNKVIVDNLKNDEEVRIEESYTHTQVQEMQNEPVPSQSLVSSTEPFTEKLNLNQKITVKPLPAIHAPLVAFSPSKVVARACTCASLPCTCGREGKRNGKEKEVEGNNTIVASEMRPSAAREAIHQVFEHWKTVMHHPNAKLDPKRKTLIARALSFGYGIEELCQAISGCSVTPHNIGDNDRHQRYDGLHVILRDSDQIDRFMRNYHYPPRRLSEAERKTNANVETLQRWMHKKMGESAYAGR